MNAFARKLLKLKGILKVFQLQGQAKDTLIVFVGNILIKISNFAKQILLAYFLGVSGMVDILLVAQIIPGILQSIVGGGGGEILVNKLKNDENDGVLITYYMLMLLSINIVLGIILVLLSDVIANVFGITSENREIFYFLLFVFSLNLLPQLFVSGLRPYLYYRGLYKYFVISSLIAESSALIFIAIFAKSMGIKSFAIGTIVASTLNALVYIITIKINIRSLFEPHNFRLIKDSLHDLFKAVTSLGGQTIVNHSSNFFERTLSVNFLTPGYLSSLNYSKSLSDFPNAIFTSSILTTTYIEQNRLKKENESKFTSYTKEMLSFYLKIGTIIQTLSLILAPFIIIIVYQRGQFGVNAVTETLLVYQILQLGFVFIIVNNFLTRTLYIYSYYKELFYIVLLKSIVHVGIIFSLINLVNHTLPSAIVFSNLLLSLFLLYKFYVITKIRSEFLQIFIKFLLVVLLGVGIIVVNQLLLPQILGFTMIELVVVYGVVATISISFAFLYLDKIGYLKFLKTKVLNRVK